MKLGVLAGAFNPVTRAHLALADAALQVVDEVVCVTPRAFPHKEFHGATLEHRLEMLRATSGGRYGVEITEGGLFVDIARELSRKRPGSELYFICGRDAAERILTWDYGEAGAVERMLQDFRLLVAGRQGSFEPPESLRHRIESLNLAAGLDHVSSTEVRRRIADGEPWEHLVPEAIVEMAKTIYG